MSRWALAGILLLAAGIRLWGLFHDLPFSYFGDELHFMKRSMALGTGDLNPHWFHKPALFMYVWWLVALVFESSHSRPKLDRYRIEAVSDGVSRVIGSVDLVGSPTDCSISPDGRWFMYGDAVGYNNQGTLYLKEVP